MVELPAGVHAIQLMVNDGHVNSQPDEVNITVVAPLECKVRITPSTINLRSHEAHILACIRFPRRFTAAEAESDEPLLIYPGGIQAARRWWTVEGHADQVSMFGFFDKVDLSGEVQNGAAELTVVGRFRSGQVFYGRDTVQVMEKGKGR